MRTLNDIHGANDAEINSYLGDVSAVDFRRHVAEFSGEQRTLRDWFAGMALQGQLSSIETSAAMSKANVTGLEFARVCYEWADAMLAARKEQP